MSPQSMANFNFSPDVRRVFERVRAEAARSGHSQVELEHFALVLLSPPWQEATTLVFCVNAEAAAARLRHRLRLRVKAGSEELPYSSAARKLIESAMTVARERNRHSVGVSEFRRGFTRFTEGVMLVASLLAEGFVEEDSDSDVT